MEVRSYVGGVACKALVAIHSNDMHTTGPSGLHLPAHICMVYMSLTTAATSTPAGTQLPVSRAQYKSAQCATTLPGNNEQVTRSGVDHRRRNL
jgi:hypothetical protein